MLEGLAMFVVEYWIFPYIALTWAIGRRSSRSSLSSNDAIIASCQDVAPSSVPQYKLLYSTLSPSLPKVRNFAHFQAPVHHEILK